MPWGIELTEVNVILIFQRICISVATVKFYPIKNISASKQRVLELYGPLGQIFSPSVLAYFSHNAILCWRLTFVIHSFFWWPEFSFVSIKQSPCVNSVPFSCVNTAPILRWMQFPLSKYSFSSLCECISPCLNILHLLGCS